MDYICHVGVNFPLDENPLSLGEMCIPALGGLPRFSPNLGISAPAARFLMILCCNDTISLYHVAITLKVLFDEHPHPRDIFVVGL